MENLAMAISCIKKKVGKEIYPNSIPSRKVFNLMSLSMGSGYLSKYYWTFSFTPKSLMKTGIKYLNFIPQDFKCRNYVDFVREYFYTFSKTRRENINQITT